MPSHPRPTIETIPMSTDARKIEFFGTLMPALLLLKSAPLRFLGYQIAGRLRPRGEIADFVGHGCDDAARIGNTLVFVQRWESTTFDPFTFAKAKTFIRQLRRMLTRAGYRATLIDPLSPGRSLSKLAQSAGLGKRESKEIAKVQFPFFFSRLLYLVKYDFNAELFLSAFPMADANRTEIPPISPGPLRPGSGWPAV